MASPSADIAVVGAGAFGLSTALRLARAGLRVRVFDRETAVASNASGVAAGMLAPVGETLAEGGDLDHLNRLLTSRDLWPDFARSIPGLELDRAGADLVVESLQALERIIDPLQRWGIDFSRLAPPGLGVRIYDDWSLDATTALAALREALKALGVEVTTAKVTMKAGDAGLAVDGEPLAASTVVIAAGDGARALAGSAPELAMLAPIKGQLVTFAPGGPGGNLLRGEGLYLAPQPSGARAGATMQPGRDDREIDPAVTERQRRAAVALRPGLAGLSYRGEAGVRAATPDGWPLVGPSRTPGVLLATGARRNGWLLAPLVSQMILDAVTGAPPHPLAQAFHPGRFTR